MIETVRTLAAFAILVALCWWITGDEDASLVDRLIVLWRQVSQ